MIQTLFLHLCQLHMDRLPLSSMGRAVTSSLPAFVPISTLPGISCSFAAAAAAAAFAGKHVRVDLSKQSKNSRIAVGSDVRAWLLHMLE